MPAYCTYILVNLVLPQKLGTDYRYWHSPTKYPWILSYLLVLPLFDF